MENAIEVKQENMPVREISVITAEIKDLFAKARTVALAFIVEIGRRLKEVKTMMPHGGFGVWLKENFDLSQSTAGNYMRLFEEYGSDQLTLFGAVSNSQSIGNLPYTKALQLLAVPAEEREEFARQVDAENISVSKLKEAIRAREDAEREMQKAFAERNEAQKRQKELEQAVAHAEITREAAQRRAEEAEEKAAKVKELETALAKAKENAASLREKLQKAEKDPQIPKETLEKIRAEAEAAARTEAGTAARETLEKERQRASLAESEAVAAKLSEQMARERLEEAEKRLKTASPEVTAFKVLFDAMQGTAAKLRAMIGNIRENDPETADKLSAALKAFAAGL